MAQRGKQTPDVRAFLQEAVNGYGDLLMCELAHTCLWSTFLNEAETAGSSKERYEWILLAPLGCIHCDSDTVPSGSKRLSPLLKLSWVPAWHGPDCTCPSASCSAQKAHLLTGSRGTSSLQSTDNSNCFMRGYLGHGLSTPSYSNLKSMHFAQLNLLPFYLRV